ncbi:hypothetical protein HPB47_020800 [Ixodes persulcatus]|uniref:Uncharacterized protein n=1 Tax=Ixodes persulcatus TaxID=34615 RepID=A0AC60QEA9_IXOPE|nr:hypothetical protein HPB47_020800 [Ixodes persulcatus]
MQHENADPIRRARREQHRHSTVTSFLQTIGPVSNSHRHTEWSETIAPLTVPRKGTLARLAAGTSTLCRPADRRRATERGLRARLRASQALLFRAHEGRSAGEPVVLFGPASVVGGGSSQEWGCVWGGGRRLARLKMRVAAGVQEEAVLLCCVQLEFAPAKQINAGPAEAPVRGHSLGDDDAAHGTDFLARRAREANARTFLKVYGSHYGRLQSDNGREGFQLSRFQRELRLR